MEARRLGATGPAIGAVGLGTYRSFNVQGDVREARCEAVVDVALERGTRLVDSSPMYGESERVLAGAIADRRDEVVVATKVWARDRALGGQQIERALDLFGGHIDVYQIHNLLGLDEHLPVLRALRDEGKVGSLGVTHYLESAGEDLIRLMRAGVVDTVQVPYHPGERWIERKLLDEAERLGIGVIVMTPLGSGSLLANPPAPEMLEPLAAFGVVTWAQVLIKWALSEPRVSCVIPATSNPDHMADNAAAGSPPWFTGDERLHVRRLVAKL